MSEVVVRVGLCGCNCCSVVFCLRCLSLSLCVCVFRCDLEDGNWRLAEGHCRECQWTVLSTTQHTHTRFLDGAAEVQLQLSSSLSCPSAVTQEAKVFWQNERERIKYFLHASTQAFYTTDDDASLG